jgi:hypothetical protein
MRAAPDGAEVVEQRLSAFRFLFCLAWYWRKGVAKKDNEAPPLDFLFHPGFALHVAGIF